MDTNTVTTTHRYIKRISQGRYALHAVTVFGDSWHVGDFPTAKAARSHSIR